MQNRFSRIALILFFIGLLAFPLVYKRLAARNKVAVATSAGLSTALARYGFSLTESSKAFGIGFKHTAPQLDAKLSHIMEQVASMGAAVSVVDFNRDGWQDIYVTNSGEGSKNALYQ
ncbi:MAG: FG-GAP repeat protein, partial [Acidobacteriota bacterium]